MMQTSHSIQRMSKIQTSVFHSDHFFNRKDHQFQFAFNFLDTKTNQVITDPGIFRMKFNLVLQEWTKQPNGTSGKNNLL